MEIKSDVMMLFLTLVCFSTILPSVSSYKILSIFPYEGKSHFFVFKPYLEELAKKGHDMTVISHFPSKTIMPRYTDVSLVESSTNKASNTELEIPDIPFLQKYAFLLLTSYYLSTKATENCKNMLANENVKKLLKSGAKFDAIIVEHFNSDCSLGLAYQFKGPVIATTSHILMPWSYKRFGIPDNAAFEPNHFLGFGTKPTFWGRLESTIVGLYFKLIHRFITQPRDQAILARHFDNVPPLEELGKNITLMLLYTYFPLVGSRLLPTNVIEVGGYHVTEPKPLDAELENFISGAEHGTIYVSFGTGIKPSSMPKEKKEVFLNVFRKLPQRVIWKFTDEAIPGAPTNVLTRSWLPQVDILGHKNVKLFISHSGNLGTNEAIQTGVPMVAMPFFGDQPANAASIEESGLGVVVDYHHVTEATLLDAIQEMMTPKRQAKVKELSSMWRDRLTSPMDTAIYWTEFVAKYGDTERLRLAAANTPYYQIYQLDIIAFLLLLSALYLYVQYNIIKMLCCRGRGKVKRD